MFFLTILNIFCKLFLNRVPFSQGAVAVADLPHGRGTFGGQALRGRSVTGDERIEYRGQKEEEGQATLRVMPDSRRQTGIIN